MWHSVAKGRILTIPCRRKCMQACLISVCLADPKKPNSCRANIRLLCGTLFRCWWQWACSCVQMGGELGEWRGEAVTDLIIFSNNFSCVPNAFFLLYLIEYTNWFILHPGGSWQIVFHSKENNASYFTVFKLYRIPLSQEIVSEKKLFLLKKHKSIQIWIHKIIWQCSSL